MSGKPRQLNAPWLRESPLSEILAVLDGAGEEARVVGGAVRNTLIGGPPGDIDIATTALPAEVSSRVEAAGFKAVPTGIEHGTITVVAAGRPFFVRRYLRAYREHFPIDTKKLAYYRAWAALRRLCRYGKWLTAGAACATCKPCAIQHITRSDLASLETYFRRWTGVRVRLS